jgi:hypothetical protein
MLIAVDDTNKKLILGLMEENIDRLVNDMPIEKPLAREDGMPAELAPWTVYILGPEDTTRFMSHFGVEVLT